MQTKSDNKLNNFVRNTQEKLFVEYTAVSEHLKTLKKFTPVLEKFDGKVIAKKFESAMKEVAETSVYLETLSYGTYLNSHTNLSHTFENGYHSYPQRYRTVSFYIHYIEGTKNKLDAEKTIAGLNSLIDGMEKARVSYDMSEALLVNKYEQLKKLEKEIEELFSDCNSVVSEQLKKQTIFLR